MGGCPNKDPSDVREIGGLALPPKPIEYCNNSKRKPSDKPTCEKCWPTGRVPGLLWGTNECPACSGAAGKLIPTATSRSEGIEALNEDVREGRRLALPPKPIEYRLP